MNPFDVLIKTPRSNCGECGYPACLAFSAAVARGGENPAKCPHLDASSITRFDSGPRGLENLSAERDFQLAEQLRNKAAVLVYPEIAEPLGLVLAADKASLAFNYLGQKVEVRKDSLLLAGTPPDDPRDRILLYNYLCSGGCGEPSEWVGMESLPNSISKGRTLAQYAEKPLAALLSRRPTDSLCAVVLDLLGGTLITEAPSSTAFVIPVLPKVHHFLLFWEEDAQEGFEPRVKILFDRNVLKFLDLESLVFSAERLSDRLHLLFST